MQMNIPMPVPKLYGLVRDKDGNPKIDGNPKDLPTEIKDLLTPGEKARFGLEQ